MDLSKFYNMETDAAGDITFTLKLPEGLTLVVEGTLYVRGIDETRARAFAMVAYTRLRELVKVLGRDDLNHNVECAEGLTLNSNSDFEITVNFSVMRVGTPQGKLSEASTRHTIHHALAGIIREYVDSQCSNSAPTVEQPTPSHQGSGDVMDLLQTAVNTLGEAWRQM